MPGNYCRLLLATAIEQSARNCSAPLSARPSHTKQEWHRLFHGTRCSRVARFSSKSCRMFFKLWEDKIPSSKSTGKAFKEQIAWSKSFQRPAVSSFKTECCLCGRMDTRCYKSSCVAHAQHKTMYNVLVVREYRLASTNLEDQAWSPMDPRSSSRSVTTNTPGSFPSPVRNLGHHAHS